MIQVVLDTNVLVAGLRSERGASFALLSSIESGAWQANISVALALEYEDVLKRNGMIPRSTATKSTSSSNCFLPGATCRPG